MNKVVFITLLAGMLCANNENVFAEGFGLTEFTTEGVAMGGARMFAGNDAGNLAYNPASLTKTNKNSLKICATQISPHVKYTASVAAPYQGIYGDFIKDHSRAHPAIAPGVYYANNVDNKNYYGIAMFARFGNMSEFYDNTVAASNNRFAKVQCISFCPTYALRADKKWSVAVAPDINLFSVEMQKDTELGHMQVKGNSWALGWNASVNYEASNKDEFALVYRSKIKHSITGADLKFGSATSDASADITLPDSYTFGYGHKFDDKNRLELQAMRCNWHTFDALTLSGNAIPGHISTTEKNWEDNWRFAVGYEHKFSEKYIGMLGFAHDRDAIPYNGGDFMVPTGNRKTYSVGVRYNDKKQSVSLALGWMKLGSTSFSGSGLDKYTSAHTYKNYANIISVGYEFYF
ncbi:MAG: outer membrane protein transport protein [Acidaminococcaceae bacterium]|nr:outer membrane protein transport protein [Acidaminococcaceae bacterium]